MSIWLVIGMSLILAVAVGIMAAINFNREKNIMQEVLSEKGAALIKSFEAGTRTGMMGMFGSESRLQTLLTETASQKDILYIVLVDNEGRILAHSDPERKGQRFTTAQIMAALDPSENTGWRTVDIDGQVISFEVYKKFLPVLAGPASPGGRRGMFMDRPPGKREGIWCQPGWMEGLPEDSILDPDRRPVIFIGMDAGPYADAMSEDIKLTLLNSAIILLLGLAGVVSLFWAQSHTRSRKLLLDTRAFASEMVANLPEGIIVAGPGRKITFINDIARDMLGLTVDNPLGRPAEEVLPENLLQLSASLPSPQKIVDRQMLLSEGGRELPVAVSATDIITENGERIGFMFILRDLTQIKRLQAAVQKQEKLAAIGNLAAGVAHEVRNPLSSIKGYATYFGSLFAEGSDNKKAAEIMTAEVDRLNRVISELLEISRPSDIKPRTTRLPDLIHSSLRLVRQDADSAGVIIDTRIDQDLEPLRLDPDRITQALINLYLNSIQAMPDGGTLTIAVSRGKTGAAISIIDTGAGIGDQEMDKIFDPYFTTKNTGTGLGLAVVQKVIEAHGGTIDIRSEVNRGTEVTLHLPYNPGEEQ